jgi:hypothetical protein
MFKRRKQDINVTDEKLSSLELSQKRLTIKNEKSKSLIDKIDILLVALESSRIDDSRTIVGSEPFYQSTFDNKDSEIIRLKILDLVSKL